MKKRALISVYDKNKILDLASFLIKLKWEIISTGGTSKYLRENKISVTDVSSVTGFPECFDGRVKTLHPAIHAGILARRDVKEDIKTIKTLKLETIDLVCVNLYPFFEKVQSSITDEEKIEFIDIGGPAMLRSAAKNFNDVIVLTDPTDYKSVIKGLDKGDVPSKLRKYLAGKVFNLTSAYDAAISRFLLKEDYPPFMPLSLKLEKTLRYGENAHQSSALYLNTGSQGALGSIEQLHGKEMGYNNIKDLDIAWKAVCAFGLKKDKTPPFGENDVKRLIKEGMTKDKVCCAAVKHNTPCGIALGDTLLDAYSKVFACDPVSIFGGIIACNTTVNKAAALKLSEIFLEIIAASDFDDEAIEILKKKKNLRIIKINKAPKEILECVSVDGGLLAQKADKILLEKWDVVTKTAPCKSDIADMIFGMRAVTFVKSNAIMVVKELSAAGIGGGQVNRIRPAKEALARSEEAIKNTWKESFDMGGSSWEDAKPARVLASDAFFPFADIVEEAAKAGIKTIIQPGGSVNDKLSIEACDKHGIAMVFTGTRHFKH